MIKTIELISQARLNLKIQQESSAFISFIRVLIHFQFSSKAQIKTQNFFKSITQVQAYLSPFHPFQYRLNHHIISNHHLKTISHFNFSHLLQSFVHLLTLHSLYFAHSILIWLRLLFFC